MSDAASEEPPLLTAFTANTWAAPLVRPVTTRSLMVGPTDASGDPSRVMS